MEVTWQPPPPDLNTGTEYKEGESLHSKLPIWMGLFWSRLFQLKNQISYEFYAFFCFILSRLDQIYLRINHVLWIAFEENVIFRLLFSFVSLNYVLITPAPCGAEQDREQTRGQLSQSISIPSVCQPHSGQHQVAQAVTCNQNFTRVDLPGLPSLHLAEK